MIQRAVWVHGTSVRAERPEALAREERMGWGSSFYLKPGTDTWFHVSIPTPVIIDDKRPKLTRLFILFRTTKTPTTFSGSVIGAVHVYDGAHRVRTLDGSRSGSHEKAIDTENTWTIDPPLVIHSGLGLSINASMPQVLGEASEAVFFSTVGADFSAG